MGRRRYDDDEDRLPAGYTCTGYNADEGRYYFRDDEGNVRRGPVGVKYGRMDLVRLRTPSPPPPPTRVSSRRAPTGNPREVALQQARQMPVRSASVRASGNMPAAAPPPARSASVQQHQANSRARATTGTQQHQPAFYVPVYGQQQRPNSHASTHSQMNDPAVGLQPARQRHEYRGGTVRGTRTSQKPPSPVHSSSSISGVTALEYFPSHRSSPKSVDDNHARAGSVSSESSFETDIPRYVTAAERQQARLKRIPENPRMAEEQRAHEVSSLESADDEGATYATAPERQTARPALVLAAFHEVEHVQPRRPRAAPSDRSRAMHSQRPPTRRGLSRYDSMAGELPNGSSIAAPAGSAAPSGSAAPADSSSSADPASRQRRPSLRRDITVALISKLERSLRKHDK